MLRACALLCLLLPGLAWAQQVFKCVDAQGRVTYSQKRCRSEAPAAKPAAPAEPAAPAKTEKLSPVAKPQETPPPDTKDEQPLVDSMGRPNYKEIERRQQEQQQQ